MFKGISAYTKSVKMLFDSYLSFSGNGIDPHSGTLGAFTDTRRGQRKVGEVRDLATHVKLYAEKAREYMAAPEFVDLDQDDKDNLLILAEETEEALAEIDDEAHPDKKWKKLSHDEKTDATQHARVDDVAIARIRARLRGDVRKAKAKPPK